MHAWLPHWIMKYFFRTFCFLLFLIFWQVMRCEHTHLSFLRFFHSSNDTWTQFPHFLGWFETKFAAFTYFVATFVLEVLLSHFMNFLVGYELWTYAESLLGRFKLYLLLSRTWLTCWVMTCFFKTSLIIGRLWVTTCTWALFGCSESLDTFWTGFWLGWNYVCRAYILGWQIKSWSAFFEFQILLLVISYKLTLKHF